MPLELDSDDGPCASSASRAASRDRRTSPSTRSISRRSCPLTTTPVHGSGVGGSGSDVRTGRLYAGFCSCARSPGRTRRPSVWDRCHQRPRAIHPTARASSPRTPSVRSCTGWGLQSSRSHLRPWWSLTPPFHPYPAETGRSVLCCASSQVTLGGRYPPSCSMEPGSSSAASANRHGRGHLETSHPPKDSMAHRSSLLASCSPCRHGTRLQ